MRDMQHEGVFDKTPPVEPKCGRLSFEDILDPMIENGMEPNRIHDESPRFLDFKLWRCSVIGALVLGMGGEKKFNRRYAPGLEDALKSEYGMTDDEISGLEAGFEGWSGDVKLPFFANSVEFQRAFQFGKKAYEAYLSAPTSPFDRQAL